MYHFFFLAPTNVPELRVTLDRIHPLPAKKPHVPRPTCKPPSLIYTSPESLQYIKERDKDVDEDYEQDSPVSRKANDAKKKAPKRKLAYMGDGDDSNDEDYIPSGHRRGAKKAALKNI